MPQLDLLDDTWIAVAPGVAAAAVAQPVRWAGWWPDFALEVQQLRGVEGVRWRVRAADRGSGTMEVWLEPAYEGVVLHYFLHAEPTGVAAWQLAKLNLAKITHRRRVAGKKMAFEVKTTLERSRPVGVSPVV